MTDTPPALPTSKPDIDGAVRPRRLPGVRLSKPAAAITELSEEMLDVIELMVHGLDEGGEIDGEQIPANQPLTLRQAARAVGVRVRRAREIQGTPLFQKAFDRELSARRKAERARSLQTAIAIRDDEGDASAATKAVRLKAIQSIEGRDGAASVQVNVSQTNNNVTPGYVIRLRPTTAQPVDDAKVIDGQLKEEASK